MIRSGKKISVILLLFVAATLLSFPPCSNVLNAIAAEQSKTSEPVVKGKVKKVSNKIKSISINVKGKGVSVVKFTDDTIFKNAEKAKDFKPGEAINVEYKEVGPNKVATVVTKVFAKLPEGVTEIKVDELVGVLQNKQPITLVDSRPSKKYGASHIPGALSIPVPKLKEKGEAVLPKDKDELLVFYCGGYT